MSKIPERYRLTQDMGVTEKMVTPPPFQENVFSQDYENIRFYYPPIYPSYRNKCNPQPSLGK